MMKSFLRMKHWIAAGKISIRKVRKSLIDWHQKRWQIRLKLISSQTEVSMHQEFRSNWIQLNSRQAPYLTGQPLKPTGTKLVTDQMLPTNLQTQVTFLGSMSLI